MMLFAGIAAVLIVLMLWVNFSTLQPHAALRAFGTLSQGRYVHDEFYPHVVVKYWGRKYRVGAKRVREVMCVMITVRVDSKRAFRIVPQTLAGALLRGKRQDVHIGYRDYDDAFVIQAADPTWVRLLLGLHHGLRSLHLSLPGSQVSLEHATLTIMAPWEGWSAEAPVELLKLSQMLADWLPRVPDPLHVQGAEYEGALTLATSEGASGGLSVMFAEEGSLSDPD